MFCGKRRGKWVLTFLASYLQDRITQLAYPKAGEAQACCCLVTQPSLTL